MGHSKCRRTFLHVGHTRSLYVYEAHSDMCAYVTLRGPRVCYIRYESGDFVLSVLNINGRERLHTKGPCNVPVRFTIM